jgi:hypothetical protein
VTPSVAPSPTAVRDPAAALDAVRAAIGAQLATGQLDPSAAKGLDKTLDEIRRGLAGNGRDKATDKVANLRTKLEELNRDGRLTDAGLLAVLAPLDELAAGLAGGGRDGD